jgi:hypothetical protein
MITWNKLAGGAILLWIFLYTASFGIWTWNKKNPLGAIAIFIIDFCAIALPFYIAFIK